MSFAEMNIYSCFDFSWQKGTISERNKAEKKKEKCIPESDLVIAPKYETPLYDLYLPKAWYSLIKHTQKSASLSQWMLWAALDPPWQVFVKMKWLP